ncbi:MAG: hypothetical protein MK008_14260 [Bdellovibrionales bacterium]|nr:hypothetical protein [Bdellovibrionales bacterium]
MSQIIYILTFALFSFQFSSSVWAKKPSSERQFKPKTDFYFIYKANDNITAGPNGKNWQKKKQPKPYYSCCYSVKNEPNSIRVESILSTIDNDLKLGKVHILKNNNDTLFYTHTLTFNSKDKKQLKDVMEKLYTTDLLACKKKFTSYKKAGLRQINEPITEKHYPCK